MVCDDLTPNSACPRQPLELIVVFKQKQSEDRLVSLWVEIMITSLPNEMLVLYLSDLTTRS